jgi:hypothetical protein
MGNYLVDTLESFGLEIHRAEENRADLSRIARASAITEGK